MNSALWHVIFRLRIPFETRQFCTKDLRVSWCFCPESWDRQRWIVRLARSFSMSCMKKRAFTAREKHTLGSVDSISQIALRPVRLRLNLGIFCACAILPEGRSFCDSCKSVCRSLFRMFAMANLRPSLLREGTESRWTIPERQAWDS